MLIFKSNARRVAKALKEIREEFPREFPRALATVGLGLRKRISAAMPNGAPPLSFKPWNAFTRFLKTRRKYKSYAKTYARAGLQTAEGIRGGLRRKKKTGELTKASIRKLERRGNLVNRIRRMERKASNAFGGILGKPDAWEYRKTKESVTVGHFKWAGKYSSAFQSRLSRPLTKEERHFRHTLQGVNIDRTYDRPAREIFKPFANDKATGDYIIDTMKKRIASIIAKAASKVSPLAEAA